MILPGRAIGNQSWLITFLVVMSDQMDAEVLTGILLLASKEYLSNQLFFSHLTWIVDI